MSRHAPTNNNKPFAADEVTNKRERNPFHQFSINSSSSSSTTPEFQPYSMM